MTVGIAGLGTALPDFIVSQKAVGEAVVERLSDPRLKRFAESLFRRSGIEARPFVIPDAVPGSAPLLYRDPNPSLGKRMAVFREHAPALAEVAARRALADAGIDPGAVTHLVVVTSTGAYTPGPDIDVAVRLGLPNTVERTLVSMMGCSGAFHGIRVARRIVEAEPAGIVLVACVEICSIHFQLDCDPGRIVAYTLFGDSAAAAVIRSDDGTTGSWFTLGRDATRLEPRYRSALQWQLGDGGFELFLGRALPDAVAKTVPGFVKSLAPEATGLGGAGSVDWWAVHPGGAAILKSMGACLSLPAEALEASSEVLRRAGNLSSASVLFVLARQLEGLGEGQSGIVLGFGPGLTLEAVHAVRGRRAPNAPAQN